MPIEIKSGTQSLIVQMTPVAVEPGELYGVIMEADTSAGISGAQIHIEGPGGIYEAVSGVNGYYQIHGIVPGWYSGYVKANGYEDYPI